MNMKWVERFALGTVGMAGIILLARFPVLIIVALALAMVVVLGVLIEECDWYKNLRGKVMEMYNAS